LLGKRSAKWQIDNTQNGTVSLGGCHDTVYMAYYIIFFIDFLFEAVISNNGERSDDIKKNRFGYVK
jgi:hypothetical protein